MKLTVQKQGAILASLLGISALSSFVSAQNAMKMPGMKMPARPKVPASQSQFSREMQRGMTTMNQRMMAAPMTGNPDRAFAAMMIPHHQGAIDMAQTELRFGKDPALRRLARQIIAAQRQEIAVMQTRLRAIPAGKSAPKQGMKGMM